MSINNVVLVGRLASNPEVTTSKGGMSICKFTLAVSRMKKDDPADFLRCVAFGKTSELIEQYVFKGNRLGVVGRIQTGSYDNKDGVKVFTTDILVSSIEFLESASKENNSAPAPKKKEVVKPIEEDEDFFPF